MLLVRNFRTLHLQKLVLSRMEESKQHQNLQQAVHGVATYTIKPGHTLLIQHFLTIAHTGAIMTSQAIQVWIATAFSDFSTPDTSRPSSRISDHHFISNHLRDSDISLAYTDTSSLTSPGRIIPIISTPFRSPTIQRPEHVKVLVKQVLHLLMKNVLTRNKWMQIKCPQSKQSIIQE